MKYEVKIPKKVKIGGFDYPIIMNARENREMESSAQAGDSSHFPFRRIRLYTNVSAQELSNTFIHEIIHCIYSVFLSEHQDEDITKGIANGIHQVTEQLGVRFVK